MTTIKGLMQTIKDSVDDLEVLLKELDSLKLIDIEDQVQAEQERNIDHANDGKI